MTKMGELSPIDPSVANPFNPSAVNPGSTPPNTPQQQVALSKIPISVEDVAAYFKLVVERAGLTTPETRLGALQALTSVVHPLALGNVERSHTLIRNLANKMLGLHMDSNDPEQQERCIQIVDTLTEKLYSHQHLIPRNEAKDLIGLKVRYPSPDLEKAIMLLYGHYIEELGIREVFNPFMELGDRTELQKEFTIAKIETTNTEDSFILKGRIVRSAQPNQPPAVNIYDQGWHTVK